MYASTQASQRCLSNASLSRGRNALVRCWRRQATEPLYDGHFHGQDPFRIRLCSPRSRNRETSGYGNSLGDAVSRHSQTLSAYGPGSGFSSIGKFARRGCVQPGNVKHPRAAFPFTPAQPSQHLSSFSSRLLYIPLVVRRHSLNPQSS